MESLSSPDYDTDPNEIIEDSKPKKKYLAEMGDIMNVTSVGFALALFKDTNMLDVLLAASRPVTSHEVAAEGNLRERYVRDILNSLASAKLLHVDTNAAGSMVYHLEAAEKEVFKTHIWGMMTFIKAIFQVYDRVKPCVARWGSNGFQIPEEFHECLEEYYSHFADGHVHSILKYIPGLEHKLVEGIQAAEVICGTSRLLNKFAKKFRHSSFSGLDNTLTFRDKYNIDFRDTRNIKYETYRLWSKKNDLLEQYDWVFCVSVMQGVPHPRIALNNIKQLMKPGGVFTMIEASTSGNPVGDKKDTDVARMYALSTFFCLPEALYQDVTGQALGMCWGKAEATDMLKATGFNVFTFDLGEHTTLYVCH